MAFWKRKKKEKEPQDNLQDKEVVNGEEDKAFSPAAVEDSVVNADTKQEPPVSEIPLEGMADVPSVTDINDVSDSGDGVILRGKKITGYFRKIVWGFLSILILPPVLTFALSILIIVAALVFPLLAVVLTALMIIVMVTLSIFLIALPVVFPLLILFLLIAGKGRLLIASEGKWFAIELFGKKYTLK
ncbi:MAG TPA: hypothetical protein VJ440_10700 [Candidatus Brocadiaceae bacterium]|nr:hypothetical protein [Candidatus Brocadiaceae bacterium]